MKHTQRWFAAVLLGLGLTLLSCVDRPALAYVEAPHSFGQIVALSTNILVVRVKAVDRTNNIIIYSKVRDLKGVHKQEEIRHNIGKYGFEPREWQTVMNWAEVGKEAVFFHNGGQAEMCLGMYWYQTVGNANDPNGSWTMTHAEPYLLRSFAGRIDKLIPAVLDVMAGKEVIVPCMVNSSPEDLKAARGKIQRLRASLKLMNYDPKRDFVGWGGEDFRRIQGMPGFTHLSTISRVDPDALSATALDINADGKPDVCLSGSSRVAVLVNSGESLGEISLPGATGSRASVWADYNGDGLPDLLLATPTGPRLYTNVGKGELRDDSHLLPHEPAYNLTCAAWIDQNGDGRPDILLGNGWHGLRLYRNLGKTDAMPTLAMTDWHYIGPFDNAGGHGGFDRVYPPEKEIDYKKKYPGRGQEAIWKPAKFTDGAINNLGLFNNNHDALVYLHRQILCRRAMELPITLGSDDGLAVFLNGQRILANNTQRACAPDQERVTLKLRAGKNDLLLKITQGGGDWAFYFQPQRKVPPAVSWAFEDVSEAVGLGASGIAGNEKGDSLTVCDLDGDGKTDFLYSAGDGLVIRNTGERFERVANSGLRWQTGRVGLVPGDYNGDGRVDLFIPQPGGCKLFRNEGNGRFVDVTATVGLDKLTGQITSAAWGDVDNDGRVDLVIGCLRGPNRFFRNRGETFEDASSAIGLTQRVFNTQAVCLVDLNGDGVLDMVFNNEGQDSVVLLGNPGAMGKNIPVTLQLAMKQGLTGSQVRVLDRAGQLAGTYTLTSGDSRGGQAPPLARFALAPGTYTVEWHLSSGRKHTQQIEVASTHFRGVLGESKE